MLRHVTVLAIATVCSLAAAYGLLRASAGVARADARVGPTTSAPSPAPAPSGAAEIGKATDGHYWARAEVDGRWVKLLVDTGASAVALTSQDARRLGFDSETLTFDHPLVTAGGRTLAAEVTLGYVSVGQARVERVPALVVRDGLSASLLGMSYLGRLSRFEATPTTLILRP